MPIRGWIGHTCFYSSRLKTRTSCTGGLALNGHKSAAGE